MSADTRRTVVIAQTTDHALAHIWRTALEADGIPAIVSGEFLGRLYAGIPQVAAVTVTVFEEDAERAVALLAADADADADAHAHAHAHADDRSPEDDPRASGNPTEDARASADGDQADDGVESGDDEAPDEGGRRAR